MKEFMCKVSLVFVGNNVEADNEDDYIEKVKGFYQEEYGLTITDDEITDIVILSEEE